ncbi:hypothetical protein P9B03_03685 [Metasolibacillus meyeri]|uniref:Uncharacterized protein n=1 Tax=Metasolibacillus meyeri TaxID=1071052 RepID=A0AAW9NNL9_9BACL|nr:hypothetical protein [Metasolibacillus meyeri]MEC1177575.1 hypothetical protein [Metasolibacillus meyeri]
MNKSINRILVAYFTITLLFLLTDSLSAFANQGEEYHDILLQPQETNEDVITASPTLTKVWIEHKYFVSPLLHPTGPPPWIFVTRTMHQTNLEGYLSFERTLNGSYAMYSGYVYNTNYPIVHPTKTQNMQAYDKE